MIKKISSSFACVFSRSTCVSVPADLGGLSVDAYISGIVAGMLQGAGFPARVTAHTVEEGDRKKAVFLVKFAASVMSRDATIVG